MRTPDPISTSPRRALAFVFAVLSFAIALLAGAGRAEAAGNVRVLTPSPQERANGSWMLRVRIDLPKEPNIVIVPMRFTFLKNMYYERTITERGKPPVLNKMRIDPARKNVLSFDVKFSDTMGHVYSATTFDFEVKRDSGYFDAGEYTLQLSSADGDIGTPQKIVLNGDNPEVDRSAVSFNPVEKVNSEKDAGAKPSTTDDTPNTMSTQVAAAGSAKPFIPGEAYDKTPDEELREHPKGCGCAIPGIDRSDVALFVPFATIAGLALVSLRRRRRGS